jgi:hypothetical protein
MRTKSLVMAACAVLGAAAAQAQSPAASACPPYFFLSGNLASNPSFELPAPPGTPRCWHAGDPTPPLSAAKDWYMHSSNDGATVCSVQQPTTVPGPGGSRMLLVRAGSNEGGVYQGVDLDPTKSYMFSVWVYVHTGHVAIQSNAFTGGPVAWTTKIGEWEQLRVCTNSLFSTNMLVVYNQDPNGGSFLVDRAEVREIPTLE